MVKVTDYLICNEVITNEESAELVSKENDSSSSENSSESGSDEEGAKPKKVKKKSSIKEIRNLSDEQLKVHLEIRKLELAAEAEARKLAAEMEFQKLQLDGENKAKELEIRRLEVIAATGVNTGNEGENFEGNKFRVDSAVKSVPLFVESEVDSFFLQFEKVATQRKWPVGYWTTLV